VSVEPVVALVRPDPNTALAERLRELATQAEDGKIASILMVKLRPNGDFSVEQVGKLSSLQSAGALAFALHDVIEANSAKDDAG